MEKIHQSRTRKTRSSYSSLPWRQDAILELNTNDVTDKDGVNKIIKRLNHLYKKDELTEKYNALESSETYKRNSNTSIHDFLTEFEKCYNKTKSHGTIWSDNLLAY